MHAESSIVEEKEKTGEAEKPATKKNPYLRWFIRLAGTGLLLIFLWRVVNLDPAKVWQELTQANLLLVALSVGLVFPLIAAKSWRWHNLLQDLGIEISAGRAFRLYSLGMSAGSFTPGAAGDFVKAWYLNREGYNLGTGILSNVLDRLFDVAALGLLAASGLAVLGADFAGVLPGLIVLLLGVGAALVGLAVPKIRNRLWRIAAQKLLRKKLTADAPTNLPNVRFIRLFWLTMLGSGIALVRVWLLALALGLNLNFMELVAASSLAQVATLIPISVAGIGPRDFALVGILQKLGYAAEKALSLSTFLLLLQVVNLLAGWLVWQFGKAKTER